MNKYTCPECNFVHDGTTSMETVGAVPKPNDIVICVNCFTVCRIGDDKKLIRLTEDEVNELIRLRPLTILKTLKAIAFIKFIKQPTSENKN